MFPKRSAKMIDGTEKPKDPSKFAKRTARYNEFRYKEKWSLAKCSSVRNKIIVMLVTQDLPSSFLARPLALKFTTIPMSQFDGQSPVCCDWPIITFDKITGFLRHGNFGLDFTEQFNSSTVTFHSKQ